MGSLFTCKGRLNRKPYILTTFFLGACGGFLAEFSKLFGISLSSPLQVMISLLVWLIALVVILFDIRRLHDLNLSGWVILLILVPLVNLILLLYLIFKKGTAGPNKYGEDPLAKNPTPAQPVLPNSDSI